MNAEEIIRLLELQPHPVEGGFFRETHRTAGILPGGTLAQFNEDRSVGTAIYFLLKSGTVSEMHQLPGDELFHFYLGDPLELLHLHPDGSSVVHVLGNDLLAGHRPQIRVPGGVWQGSRPLGGAFGFTLLGCTMAPGFDYADYVRGQRAELVAVWPGQTERINLLTPNG